MFWFIKITFNWLKTVNQRPDLSREATKPQYRVCYFFVFSPKADYEMKDKKNWKQLTDSIEICVKSTHFLKRRLWKVIAQFKNKKIVSGSKFTKSACWEKKQMFLETVRKNFFKKTNWFDCNSKKNWQQFLLPVERS